MDFAIRVCLIAIEVFLGMLIPFFSTLLGLAGALSILACSFYIPCESSGERSDPIWLPKRQHFTIWISSESLSDIFYLARFWKESGMMIKIGLSFLSITCILFSITGLISSISTIVEKAQTFVLF